MMYSNKKLLIIISVTILTMVILIAVSSSPLSCCEAFGNNKKPVDPLRKYSKLLKRSFDTTEREWFAKECLRTKDEAKQMKANPEKYKSFISSVNNNNNIQEIRSDYELRYFLSTGKQVWVAIYDSKKIAESSPEKQSQVETFKQDFARFADTVTLSGAAAVVGALDVSSPSIDRLRKAKYPQFFNGGLQPEDTNNDDEDDGKQQQQQQENTNKEEKMIIEQESGNSNNDDDDLVQVRYYPRGGKFFREETSEDEDGDEVTTSEELRLGVSEIDAELRPSFLYKGSKDYKSLKEAAFNLFKADSLVHDRTLQSVDELETVTEEKSIFKKSIVMIVPTTSSSPTKFDGDEFAFHFISGVPPRKDVTDEFNFTIETSTYKNKLVFVIADEDSEIGKQLMTDADGNNNEKLVEPLLLFYERRRTTSEEELTGTNEETFESKFSVQPYRGYSSRDFKNVAFNLVASIRPRPTFKTIPAPECDTLKECYEKFPKLPFIVRNPPEIVQYPENDPKTVIDNLMNKYNDSCEDFIESVSPVSGDVEFEHVGHAVRDFLGRRLSRNVFDGGGVTNWWRVPQILKDHTNPQQEQSPQIEVVVLSPDGSYTFPHFDISVAGSIFQHVFVGRKVFYIIDPEKYRKVLDCPYTVAGVPPEESAGVCKHTPRELMAKNKDIEIEVYVMDAGPGSFVMWPPGWIHEIYTYEAALVSNGFQRLDRHFVKNKK